MARTRHHKATSPLAHEYGTRRQSIIELVLMAIVCEVSWDFIAVTGTGDMYWPHAELISYEWHLCFQAGAAKAVADLPPQPFSTTRPPVTSTMPRIRGKSRHGAAWYRAESQRKRLKHFEKAITLASIRRKRNPRVPPMAIPENTRPEEALQTHPPMADFEERRPRPEAHQGKQSVAEQEAPHCPSCIVEEEEPPDEIQYPPCIVKEEEPPVDAKVQKEEERTPPRPPGDSSARTAKNPGVKTSSDKERGDQATFPELWHLPLVFELRSMLDDLAFRIARMDQRIDMLFAALSKNAPKKQCPTCAQEYSIPAGWSQAGHKRARSSQQLCRGSG